MRKKVTIVGSGNVGATAAHWIASKELADVVLIDIIEGVPQGKGLDLLEAMPIEKRDSYVIGTQRLRRHRELRRRGGHGRHPAQAGNEPRRSAQHQPQDHERRGQQGGAALAQLHSDHCLESLDAMAQAAYKMSGFPRERVIGMAGVLDSARFRTFIAQELKVSVENVTAFVLGGHGDTMVPLPRYSTVAGIPITELLDAATRRAVGATHARRRRGNCEVSEDRVGVLRAFGGGDEMVEAILKDKKKILPCAAYLQGEYGINGLYVGVPCKLGAKGLEQIIEIKLTPEEKAALDKSAAAVKELVAVIGV